MNEFATWIIGQIPALLVVFLALGLIACLVLLAAMGVMAVANVVGELVDDHKLLKESKGRKGVEP